MISKHLKQHDSAPLRLAAPTFTAFDINPKSAITEISYILGLPLVAAIMGRAPSIIESWLGEVEMTSAENLTLRTALHASRMISCRLPSSIVRRWFISPCDEISGRSPLEALSKMAEDGNLDTRSNIILAAERYWRVR